MKLKNQFVIIFGFLFALIIFSGIWSIVSHAQLSEIVQVNVEMSGLLSRISGMDKSMHSYLDGDITFDEFNQEYSSLKDYLVNEAYNLDLHEEEELEKIVRIKDLHNQVQFYIDPKYVGLEEVNSHLLHEHTDSMISLVAEIQSDVIKEIILFSTNQNKLDILILFLFSILSLFGIYTILALLNKIGVLSYIVASISKGQTDVEIPENLKKGSDEVTNLAWGFERLLASLKLSILRAKIHNEECLKKKSVAVKKMVTNNKIQKPNLIKKANLTKNNSLVKTKSKGY